MPQACLVFLDKKGKGGIRGRKACLAYVGPKVWMEYLDETDALGLMVKKVTKETRATKDNLETRESVAYLDHPTSVLHLFLDQRANLVSLAHQVLTELLVLRVTLE